MRLLHINETGDITLVRRMFYDDQTPPYAILSHTWLDDAEEPTLQDLHNGLGTEKLGYQKIQFCGEQARRDGLEYFWVDTCCIDKSSSSELSEAINSMYRWYEQARVCYAYLSDVPDRASATQSALWSEEEWEEKFAAARWFTRGWTLQELIAPEHVVFYSHNWQNIGTKSSRRKLICRITWIPSHVLREESRSLGLAYSIMRWASRRSTTRVEDMAYCLMGLFDVHMPLLYGEGHRAFERLQQEILKVRDEHSLLCWTDPSASTSTYHGLLARSPAEFSDDVFSATKLLWHHEDSSIELAGSCTKFKLRMGARDGRPWEYLAFIMYSEGHEMLGVYLAHIAANKYLRVDANKIIRAPCVTGGSGFRKLLTKDSIRDLAWRNAMVPQRRPSGYIAVSTGRLAGIMMKCHSLDFDISIRYDAGGSWNPRTKILMFDSSSLINIQKNLPITIVFSSVIGGSESLAERCSFAFKFGTVIHKLQSASGSYFEAPMTDIGRLAGFGQGLANVGGGLIAMNGNFLLQLLFMD